MFQDGELDLAKDRLLIFQVAASQYNWPTELVVAMQADLGTPDWMTLVLAAIDSRESRFGLLLDADGLGDAGHGHGEMQIDDRSHTTFCSNGGWKDLASSLAYIHRNVIIPSYNYLANRFGYFQEDYAKLFWGVVAAYNCGAGNVAQAVANGDDVDSRTTGHDYSADVRARALALKETLG